MITRDEEKRNWRRSVLIVTTFSIAALIGGYAVGTNREFAKRVPYVIPGHDHMEAVLRLDCNQCVTIMTGNRAQIEKAIIQLNGRVVQLEKPPTEDKQDPEKEIE